MSFAGKVATISATTQDGLTPVALSLILQPILSTAARANNLHLWPPPDRRLENRFCFPER